MAEIRVTSVLTEFNGRKFVKTAIGDTEAHARALATAELAITCGDLVSETIRLNVTPEDTTNVGTSYSDAEFTFRNGAKFTNVHFEQLANGYEEPNSGGFINVADPAIAAWATAWSNAHGGGYTLVHGRYVR